MFMAMPAGVGRGVRGLGLGWVHERREGEGERETKKKVVGSGVVLRAQQRCAGIGKVCVAN